MKAELEWVEAACKIDRAPIAPFYESPLVQRIAVRMRSLSSDEDGSIDSSEESSYITDDDYDEMMDEMEGDDIGTVGVDGGEGREG